MKACTVFSELWVGLIKVRPQEDGFDVFIVLIHASIVMIFLHYSGIIHPPGDG